MVHTHAVHLPLGALLSPCTTCVAQVVCFQFDTGDEPLGDATGGGRRGGNKQEGEEVDVTEDVMGAISPITVLTQGVIAAAFAIIMVIGQGHTQCTTPTVRLRSVRC